jgi:signal transduction histidine kinase
MNTKSMPDGTVQSIIRDISERRRAQADKALLEEELRQSQKMEAIGRIAAGIAHDFNNALMIIDASAGLALRDVHPDSRAGRCLSEIHQAGERAAALTRQLLAFGRKQNIVRRPVDLGKLLGDLRPMLSRVLGNDVSLEIHVPPEVGLVELDAGQTEQALLNLAINARDAMPKGGRFRLDVGNVELDSVHAEASGTAVGPHVALKVSDSGSGMTEEVRERVFEPFFTTKEHGTGLGLAMVYGAVRQSGGSIHVDSVPGSGTTFRILLPRLATAPASHAQPMA